MNKKQKISTGRINNTHDKSRGEFRVLKGATLAWVDSLYYISYWASRAALTGTDATP